MMLVFGTQWLVFNMEVNMDYKNAGVDIEAGYKSVELIKKHVATTMRPEVFGGTWRICRYVLCKGF